ASNSGKKGNPRKAAEYHAQLGIGYLQRNRLHLAKEYLEKALRANPRSPTVQHYNALLQERLGNDQLAGKHFAKAVRRDGKNPELLNNYGSFLCKRGALQQAEAAFLKAAADPLYKTPEFAFANAGICLKKQGEQQRAESYLRKALALNPEFPSALFHMADLYHHQSENAKAQAYLYRYNERVSDTPETLLLCYRIHTALNEAGTAQQCSGRLLANFPHSKEASELN
ncbi:MAG: type IV pilus biogenesis/stability protein PilW, partial [Thiolinea sp.]